MIALALLVACGKGPAFPDPAAELLAALDADGSGDLAADELRAYRPADVLAHLDTDGSGAISVEELRADLDVVPVGRPAGRRGRRGPAAPPPP